MSRGSQSGPPRDLWQDVRDRLEAWSEMTDLFKYGQRDSIRWISRCIAEDGLIIADEVGLGKTRLALLVMLAVLRSGGNVVAIVPPGLLYQWRQEARDLRRALLPYDPGIDLIQDPTMVRSYGDLFRARTPSGVRFPLTQAAAGRWTLVSQTFDLYTIRANARAWRLELPALVRAHVEMKNSANNNNRWIQYRRQRGYGTTAFMADPINLNQDVAADYLATLFQGKPWPATLDSEDLRPNLHGGQTADDVTTQLFQIGQPGRKLLMNFIGELLGKMDLVVIDEAHKSRDDERDAQTRLGRLLADAIITGTHARRLSMTATPVELGPEQWLSLLRRSGVGEAHPDWNNVKTAISRFAASLEIARHRPNHPRALDELILAASEFEKRLKPYVTRRRRIEQDEMKALLVENPRGAHPHRNIQMHPIKIEELSADWRGLVLVLEGLGLASKGLKGLTHAERQADIRYSSGLDVEVDLKLPEDRPLTPQEKRLRAWDKVRRAATNRLSGEGQDWLWTHPRVLAAADRIEQLCRIENAVAKEKVLVFGRFTKAMRALRDTLSARHVLRVIDAEATALLPGPGRVAADLLTLTYTQMRKTGAFTGTLAGKPVSAKALGVLADEARRRYHRSAERLRTMVTGVRDESETPWPGAGSLDRLKLADEQVYKDLFDTLRHDVFDRLLQRGQANEVFARSTIEQLTRDVWTEHYGALIHADDEGKGNDEDVDASKLSSDTAASIPTQRFKDYLRTESGERRSEFCRVLDGDVSPMTRRSIQASFNHAEAGPYVLIAQSLVGREGLNLHRACSQVFLFHPEWNPGVIEQQIGRVDRIASRWEELAKKWKSEGRPESEYPKILIDMLVFEGTYDEFQAQVLRQRRASMNAQLFGALLDEETLVKVSDDYKEKLVEAAPSFSPKDIPRKS